MMLTVPFLIAYAFLLVTSVRALDDSKYLSRKRRDFTSMFTNRSILAFGDSLTFGMNVLDSGLAPPHPYAIELRKLIDNIQIYVHEFGLSGEQTSGMLIRLPSVLKRFEMKTIKLAIILGGTNDLSHGDPTEILSNLIALHQIVHKVGTPSDPVFSIAIAIPDLRWDIDHSKRHQINRGLFEYAQKCNHLVHYRDFDHLFNQSIKENHKYWSVDMVHFSALGYDEIGRHLYNDIINIAHRASVSSNFGEMC